MSKLLTVVILCMVTTTRANEPVTETPKIPTVPAPPLGDTIVGESVPLHMETYYYPATYCKVDPAAEPDTQLNECKKQRKGWLKI